MHNILKRTWAEINLDSICRNMAEIRSLTEPGVQVMAVIKADGYGHGAVELAKTYEANGVEWFAVSNLDEALQLRNSGVTRPILILGFTPAECAATLAKENISQTVLNEDYGEALSREAVKAGVRVHAHIKADTGMSRIGFYYHDAELNADSIDKIATVCALPGLLPEGIFMHFASADEGENGESFTRGQFALFQSLLEALAARGVTFKLRHCCNSAATVAYPEFHLDLIRPGIILYGLAPSPLLKNSIALTPALELKSIVSQVKTIPAGTAVSYGRTYTSQTERKIATIPIGYADGYPRLLSGKADVLICGKRARITGRVCMDQLMADVTDIPEAAEGCVVTLIGKDANEEISLDELAELTGTINYELACNISKRVPRVYLRGGKVIENMCYIN